MRSDNTWREENNGSKAWDREGIAGLYFPKYDKTLCIGCSYLYSPIFPMIMSVYQGRLFNKIEILTGKPMKSSGNAVKNLLIGNCMIKARRKDPTIKEVILAKGCPPSFKEVIKAFEKCGIHVNIGAYQTLQYTLINRYQGKEEFGECFFYLR